jgi:predicted secreted protein
MTQEIWVLMEDRREHLYLSIKSSRFFFKRQKRNKEIIDHLGIKKKFSVGNVYVERLQN